MKDLLMKGKMMQKEQPEALRLADALEADQQGIDLGAEGMGWGPRTTTRTAAAELRRLHAENEALRAQIGQGEPEIDYEALIAAAYKRDRKWAQGTNGCVAFKCGAEWFRSQMLASSPSAPKQKPMTEYERVVMYAALSCVQLQEKDPATMFKMIVEGVERFHNIGEKK